MNLRKWLHGFNMLGNRISNVTVDEPTAAGNPVPLDYLQESQTYDTAPATSQHSSPVMPWATNLQNLSLKPLLDKVLFPTVPAIWAEPVFASVKLTVLGEYYTQAEKHLLMTSVPKTMRLDYVITPNDRVSGVVAVLVVTKVGGATQTFNSTTTSDTTGTVNFTFDFENIQSIALTKVWQASSVVKNDNYGNPSKPSEYNSPYTLSYDVWALIQDKNIVTPPVIYINIGNSETGYDSGLSATTLYTDLISWTKDKRFFLQPGNSNAYTILIPTSLLNSAKLYALFGGQNLEIDDEMLAPGISGRTTTNITYFGATVPYTVCTLDFGYFDVQTNLDFQFVALGL
jgi:hypothetical protein